MIGAQNIGFEVIPHHHRMIGFYPEIRQNMLEVLGCSFLVPDRAETVDPVDQPVEIDPREGRPDRPLLGILCVGGQCNRPVGMELGENLFDSIQLFDTRPGENGACVLGKHPHHGVTPVQKNAAGLSVQG